MPELGKFLVILGAVIVILGLLLWTGIGSSFLGKLPGDIRIERGNSAFYFPIVTCIIISIVLSLLFSLFRR
jgi:ribose/xylose/arabinose/galactoside ABC-type transport system permease subunit